ncbi:MAG: serine/threonine-protein kinase [Polyangiaceae bacterium]
MSSSQNRLLARRASRRARGPYSGSRAPLTPVADTDPALLPVTPELHASKQALLEAPFEDRYAKPRLLGRGGMGEVYLLRDGRVGRDVAFKRIRRQHTGRTDLESRFLREARVQGQLEHPSVVPVYDVGVTPEGEAYFTMKRIQGLTLATIISGLRNGDHAIRQHYNVRRVLGAISRACLALAYAHTRGVIHRDLKPANIMLGDYGEVYLLDWGVAKVTGANVDSLLADAMLLDEDHEAEEVAAGDTGIGSLLGTPGYIAPEQARGMVSIDFRADIYSMGAILFEVLALEPLHRGREAEDLLQSTFLGTDLRPSARAKAENISQDLDEICQRACALNPAERFTSAREMSEAIERYLHGARDDEQRTQMSQRHTINAQLHLAHATLEDVRTEKLRVEAMRELGRALALNPDNQAAFDTLMRALTAAPGQLPPEAEAELAAASRRDHARAANVRGMAYLTWLLAVQAGLYLGVSNVNAWLALSAVLGVLTIYNFWMASSRVSHRGHAIAMMVLAFAAVGMVSGLFGPFVLVPTLAVATSAALIVSLRAERRLRWLITLLAVASVLVPTLLDQFGLHSISNVFGQTSTLLPTLGRLPQRASLLLVTALSLVIVVFANVLVGRAVDALVKAERRGFARAWRLRQLLPKRARDYTRRHGH